MKFENTTFLRKAILWLAPMTLLSGTAAHAQWAQPYGYYDDYGHATRGHEREERWYYGNSWELRQHQREERHQLKHHQQHERGYGDFNGFYGRYGYSNRGSYDGRRY